MKRAQSGRGRRPGVAAVEMAVVMTFVLVPLMIGVWEMGRTIHVQQVVSNAAREGARLAAQGHNAKSIPIQMAVANGSNPTYIPNVKAAVYQSLIGAGLTNLAWADVTVVTSIDPGIGVKNQLFTVKVSVPYAKVRWVEFGLVNPTTIEYTVQWRMLVDDPFVTNTTIPTW